MQNKRKKVISLILCLLMMLALLPAANAETARSETADRAVSGTAQRGQSEKGEMTASERTIDDTALKVGENQFTVAAGETVYRPFTPSKDGYYRIYSVCDYDTYGILTDSEMNQIIYNDDGGNGNNFLMQYKLTAGVTYYIGARYYYSGYSGTISVHIDQYGTNYCGDNVKWSFNSETGKLKITGTGEMWDFTYSSPRPWTEYEESITSLSIGTGVTYIGAYAFYNLYNLTSVTIPGNVVRIGESAFAYCSGLTKAVLKEGVTMIGELAFYNCSSLTKITVPESLESIERYAFESSGITAFNVPAAVSYIGVGAFSRCRGLQPSKFKVSADSPYYKAEDGVLLSKDGTLLHTYLCASARTEYTVPEGVKTIGTDSFIYCGNLTSVILPDGVKTIDNWAFECSDNLQTVTLPTSLTSINYGAFYYTVALTDVYYGGTYAMRESTLTVDNEYRYNDSLLNAHWHYADETDFDGSIEWNEEDLAFKGTTPYVIADGTAHTPRFTVKDADGKVIASSKYTYEYRENVNAGTAYVLVTFKSGYTGTARGWFKIYLPATTNTYVENTADGIKVIWNPVEGAAGYVIYRRAWNTSSSGWTAFSRWDNVTETTYLDGHDDSHKVYAGTRYQYGVKAYFKQRTDPVTGATIGGNVGDNYNLGEVGPLKTTVRITTRELTKLVAGSGKITAYWSPSKNFTGYQIQRATDADFTKNVKTVKITDPTKSSTALGSLTNGTLYYVRIRSYHEFEGMTYFGGWSNVLFVKPGSGQTVTPSSATYRALCIGQNYTGSSNQLNGCINDMNALAGMLSGLTNSFNVTKLKDASKTKILNGITSAFAGAKETDVSVFTYSGHGTDAGGSGSYQGALCSFESDGSIGYITLNELATALSKVPGRVIVFLDSCHSGSAIKGNGNADEELEAFNQAAVEAFSGYWLEDEDVPEGAKMGEFKKSKFIVIAAAAYDESSWDGYYDGSGYAQGAFTSAVVKGMASTYPNGTYNGKAMPADKNSDKLITLKELFDYAYQTAYNSTSGTGTPQHAQYYGTDSEILFRRK